MEWKHEEEGMNAELPELRPLAFRTRNRLSKTDIGKADTFMENMVLAQGGRVGSPNTARLLKNTCSPDQIRYTHYYPGGVVRSTEVPSNSIPTLPY